VRIVGHPRDYLLSHPYTSVIHPEDVAQVVQRHERRLRGEPVEALYGFRCITQQGEVRSLELSAVKFEWEQRAATLMFVVDVSERLLAEHNQRMALQKQSELNNMKQRFISMTSHEFRTPLATIHGSVELLQNYDSRLTPERKQQTLHKIDESVQRMTHMLENVLQIGRQDAGQLEFRPRLLAITPFCLALIDELRSALTRQYEALKLELDLPEAQQQFMLDDMLIRNMVGNLLTNAFKYSRAQGVVRLQVRPLAQHLEISVSDQGIGIPEADQAHLFESFFRASNVGAVAGTGLGLTIIKNAVDCHQGHIAVRSEVGVGSQFTITLPLLPVASQSTDT